MWYYCLGGLIGSALVLFIILVKPEWILFGYETNDTNDDEGKPK